MKLNLALAQIATKLGDVESNLEKHLDYIKQAKSQGADLLVFPELSLTGYVLQDLVATVAHRPTADDPTNPPLDQPTLDGTVCADDFESGTIAAACGGTTTVIPFARQFRGQSLRG